MRGVSGILLKNTGKLKIRNKLRPMNRTVELGY